VTIVAIAGDATTTTAVAIAAGWPTDRGGDVVVLEADPHGGSLAGWLDTPAQPSLATIVANAGIDAGRSHRTVLDTVDAVTRRSDSGVRFIPNAVRARAAHRAVEEAALVVVPALAGAPTVVLADVGRLRAGDTLVGGARAATWWWSCIARRLHRHPPPPCASSGSSSLSRNSPTSTLRSCWRSSAGRRSTRPRSVSSSARRCPTRFGTPWRSATIRWQPPSSPGAPASLPGDYVDSP
jgi:hypothetical protein